MRGTKILLPISPHLSITLNGCQSHVSRSVEHCKSNTTNLEHQFQKDCSAEMLNLPPKLSHKCADEKSKSSMMPGIRLQAERAKNTDSKEKP